MTAPFVAGPVVAGFVVAGFVVGADRVGLLVRAAETGNDVGAGAGDGRVPTVSGDDGDDGSDERRFVDRGAASVSASVAVRGDEAAGPSDRSGLFDEIGDPDGLDPVLAAGPVVEIDTRDPAASVLPIASSVATGVAGEIDVVAPCSIDGDRVERATVEWARAAAPAVMSPSANGTTSLAAAGAGVGVGADDDDVAPGRPDVR